MGAQRQTHATVRTPSPADGRRSTAEGVLGQPPPIHPRSAITGDFGKPDRTTLSTLQSVPS